MANKQIVIEVPYGENDMICYPVIEYDLDCDYETSIATCVRIGTLEFIDGVYHEDVLDCLRKNLNWK